MKKMMIICVSLFFVDAVHSADADTEQIVIVTKISVSSKEAERIMNLILDDAAALDKKYQNEKGIRDVAIEMENKTRLRRLRSAL